MRVRARRVRVMAGGVIGVLVLGAIAAIAQTDPLVGTWILNVSKSTYPSGRAPASQSVTFERVGDMTHMISVVTGADGKTIRREYAAKNDGKDYPFPGSTAADTIALRQVDATTFERVDKKGGKVVSVLTRKMSADGKSFAVTTKDANGRENGTVAVYELKPGSRKP